MSLPDLLTLQDVEEAYERIREHIELTPVMRCAEADRITGREIYFKAEQLQLTGAFKIRGALSSAKLLKSKQEAEGVTDPPGVVTHSSGNHGLALAWASKIIGFPCTVIVPKGTPPCKIEAVKNLGAELIESYPSVTGRIEAMKKVCAETGKVYISSCENVSDIAGQGTCGLELIRQVPDLDAVLVSISGGGLSAGIAVAVKSIKPDCKIYLVTPRGKMMEQCLRSGEREWPNPPRFLDTIAEGIRLQQTGQRAFKILRELAEKEVIEVSDEEIIAGMKFTFNHMKQVIEAAAGATVAALFTEKMAALPASIKKVAVISCGGNVDIDNLPWYESYVNPFKMGDII